MQLDQKSRIAVAVFEQPEKLQQVLQELQTEGLSIGQTLVLVQQRELGKHLEIEFSRWQADSIREIPRIMIRSDIRGAQLGRASGKPLATIGLPAGQLVHFEKWITNRLATELIDDLHRGSCVLIVPIKGRELEIKVSTCLLDHASHSVQLHDV